jgi:hypothetical protein
MEKGALAYLPVNVSRAQSGYPPAAEPRSELSQVVSEYLLSLAKRVLTLSVRWQISPGR